MYKKIILILFIFALILIPYSFSLNNINETHAETTVNYQIIDEDTIWTLESSPFLIYFDDITVLEGAILTIEPGVIVKLDRMNINIEGRLNVQGNEDNPVIFTSINNDEAGGKSVTWSNGNPQAGDWGAIKVKEGGAITMNNSIVSYGGEEEMVPMLVKRVIKPNIVKAQGGFEIGVISSSFNTETVINNTKIINNLIGLQLRGNVQINNSQISDNIVGLMLFSDQVIIHNSEIYNNIFDGLVNFTPNQVDATNNWWGDDSGPYHKTLNPEGKGDKVSDNVLFDPWIQKNSTKRNPVIIVPGIIASKLETFYGEEIWPNFEEMKWAGDKYLNVLRLDNYGNEIIDMNPVDIFRKEMTKDFFQGLITELEENGYEEGVDLFVFPYDWRLDIGLIANSISLGVNMPYSLKSKIEAVITTTSAEKVDIIAHSMGGLVTKAYIEKNGKDKIDKFIDIASPHLGSPKAYKILMHGDGLGMNVLGVGLNEKRVKIITQNMPSIYQLLPSKKYFNERTIGTFELFDGYVHNSLTPGSSIGMSTTYNYNDTLQFIADSGRNKYLLGKDFLPSTNINKELHDKIDNMEIENSYNIIGCGQATISEYFLLNKEKNGKIEYDIRNTNGDGTVPLKSAEDFGQHKYYTNATTHAHIPSVNGVRQLITSILNNEVNSFEFDGYDSLSKDKSNICSLSGYQFSVHSPLELHIYDSQDNHVGPNENGDIEMNIEGAQYDIIGDNKFVFLPNSGEYKIIGQATDSGNFNFRAKKIENSKYTKSTYYNQIPLTSTSTNIEIEVDTSIDIENYIIKIDQDGDNIFEEEIEPDSILDEEEMKDLTKPTTTISITGQQSNNNYYISNIEIELTAIDPEPSTTTPATGILKTEYSLNNGQTWQNYKEPIVITKDGEHKILYSSTDKAGNREINKEEIIEIDRTNSEILITAPSKIGIDEKLHLEYKLTDNHSGIATNTIEIYFDNKKIENFEIDMFYEDLGEYEIKIIALDNAGNKTEEISKINIVMNNNEYKQWQLSGANYKIGDIASYNNKNWKCIQTHSTYGAPSWSPESSTGVLWQEYKGDIKDDEPDKAIDTEPVYEYDSKNRIIKAIFKINIVFNNKGYREWQIKGVTYKINDTVLYNNKEYKCIQAHTTHGDPNWNPETLRGILWKEEGY